MFNTVILDYLTGSYIEEFSYNFFLYITEIFVAEILFAYKMRKRDHFIIRASLAMVVLFLGSYFAAEFISRYSAGFRSITVFAISWLCLYICFENSILDSLFCVIAGYALQNVGYSLFMIFTLLFELNFVDPLDIFLYIFIYISTYTIGHYFCSKRLVKGEDITNKHMSVLFIAFISIISTIYLQYWLIYEGLYDNVAVRAPLMFCNILTLFIQFGWLKQNELTQEKQIMTKVIEKEGKQNKMTRANIDIMNIKFHDMKKQINDLSTVGIEDKKNIQEITSALAIYGSITQTGNKALDVVLYEKKFYCEEHSIQFTYILNGEQLNFISPADIVSIFGNALDNAIEYVEKFENKEKRIISLNVKQHHDLLLIHVENYCEAVPEFVNGFPLTSKSDKNYHGFGTKSIKHTANKYNGNVCMSYKNHLFNVDVMLPVGANDN